MSLEAIDSDTALELYPADRANELAAASMAAHEYRLGHFVRWCDQVNHENLNSLSGRKLHEYRLWRRDESDRNMVSEKTQTDTLCVFVRWLESVDGVTPMVPSTGMTASVRQRNS